MRHRLILVLGAACLLVLGAQGVTRVLRPIAAGTWYPSDPVELRAAVEKYIEDAKVELPEGRVVACIVPHAAYEFSGAVAGHAFKAIQPGSFNRVILLGPSHFTSFRGCSIPSVQVAKTPLGKTALDGPSIRRLDMSTLIDVRSISYTENIERIALHEREHSTEVVLPFLQVRLGAFSLIPMLVSDFRDYNGRMDEAAIESVAARLRGIMDERTLVVVSSDFTHFGNRYSYKQFREDILKGIETLDRQAFDIICHLDYKEFVTYLEQTGNTICGKTSICILLKLLPKTCRGVVLDYDVSAKKTGDLASSVSYAAIAFVDRALR